jgi:flagellar FliL protein
MVGEASDFPAKVAQDEPQLRDAACGLLSSKTIPDLEKPGARNLIRGELIAGFNSILGDGSVREIYFTEFAIQ